MDDQNDKTGTRGSQRKNEATTTTGKERVFYNAENPGMVSNDFLLASLVGKFAKISLYPHKFGDPRADAWNKVSDFDRQSNCETMTVMVMNMDDDEEGYFYYKSPISPKKHITFEWWEQKVNACFRFFASDVEFAEGLRDNPHHMARTYESKYDLQGNRLEDEESVPKAEMYRREILNIFRELARTLPAVQRQRKKRQQ